MDVIVTTVCTIISIPFKIWDWIHDTFFTLDLSKKGPVLITGCDTGFGHLLAIKLVQNGINTFAGCLTENGENELKKVAGKGPGKLWTLRMDVSSQQSVDSALQFVKQTLGPGKGLWGLVNNAGIAAQPGPDDWLTVEHYQRALDVNFLGVVRATHAFKPLVKRERGRIVTVTSIFGRIASTNCGPYCASKFAAEAYCDTIRRELADFGVSVHIVEPGFFATNLTKPALLGNALSTMWDKISPELKEAYGDQYIKESLANLETTLPPLCNTNLGLVVDCYYHALTSYFPSRRYYGGLDAKIFYVPLSMLPGSVQDWILKVFMSLAGVPVPKAAKKS